MPTDRPTVLKARNYHTYGMKGKKESKRRKKAYIRDDLPGFVVDEGDDPRAGALDELDIGGGDVGGVGRVAEPSGGAVAGVGDDSDHG